MSSNKYFIFLYNRDFNERRNCGPTCSDSRCVEFSVSYSITIQFDDIVEKQQSRASRSGIYELDEPAGSDSS